MEDKELNKTKKQNKRLKGVVIGLSALLALGVAASIAGPLIVLNKYKGSDSGSEIIKEHNIVIESSTKYNVKVFKKGTTTEVSKAKKGDELTFLVTSIETLNSLQPAFIKINSGHYQLTKSASDEKWEVTVKIELVEDMYVSVVEQDISGTFVVTFKDGSETISTQKVLENEKAIKPQDPTKDDYSFVNWYDNESCEGDPFNFDSPITKATTLYAKWTYDFAPELPKYKSATTLFAVEHSTIHFAKNGELLTSIFYSTTGAEDSWVEAQNENIVIIPKGGCLYLKGNNSTGLSSSTGNYWNIKFTGKCNVGGSVMGLLDDGKGTITDIPSNYCFYALFHEQGTSTGLNKISSNFLPSINLKDDCYTQMFDGCTSLINAPKLPAATLAKECYYRMFYGCTSLINAPKLPATTVAEKCCSNMFRGCTSLISAPEELPALELKDYCYADMFYGCTSLINAPKLPATTLAKECYIEMFYKCASLVSVPEELPALELKLSSYNSMFSDCSSLTTAPIIKATTLATTSCQWMFQNCSNLTQAPSLSAVNLANTCYYEMFKDCISLTTAPELPATELKPECYCGMFSGCINLKIKEVAPSNKAANEGKIFTCPDLSEFEEEANPVDSMFENTAGTFTGNPTKDNTYYWYTE